MQLYKQKTSLLWDVFTGAVTPTAASLGAGKQKQLKYVFGFGGDQGLGLPICSICLSVMPVDNWGD